ncbi:hypothetical protein BDZ45DRAFT_673943 [Acephala macrosclerotiorum]|nr:hypothetical protein BDZ45DRAFT_673943 [Acephala macrosclerotiorum]
MEQPYMGPMYHGALPTEGGGDLPRSLHPGFRRAQVYRRRRKASTGLHESCRRHPLMEPVLARKLFPRRSASYPAPATRMKKRSMSKYRKPIPPKPEPRSQPSLPPKAVSNIFCYFTSSTIPILLFPKTTAKDGYDQDLNEIRTLVEIFGETRIWAIDTKDACCPYCVERMNYLERHKERETRLKTKYYRNVFLRVNCPHQVVSSLERDGVSIFSSLGCML